MNLQERQRLFDVAVRQYFEITRNSQYNRAYGVSNSAKVIEGGLQLGVVNLERFEPDVDQFVLACVIRFPPADEVFFAVQVKAGLQALHNRLSYMRAAGESGEKSARGTEETEVALETDSDSDSLQIRYSHRNNVVATYLANDGNIYLRNKGFWDTLLFSLSQVGPSIPVDSVVFSLYPPSPSARRGLLTRDFVGYLSSLVGSEKIHELAAWGGDELAPERMWRMPAEIPLSEILQAINAAGGHYIDSLVERYHAGLNFHPTKHFVILSGLSGTGKTQLAIKYGRAVHGLTDNVSTDHYLYVCPVRPDWTDPSGLTGYYDVLTNRYVVPPFLESVLLAITNRDRPVFVLIDELNLARIEYYLSDVLSAIETGVPLQLHSSSVPLEGSNGAEIRGELPLPPNLYITGTINVDETTNPISDKVLDRAVVIDMSAVDLSGFLDRLRNHNDLRDGVAACQEILSFVHGQLIRHRMGFGYRTVEEFIRYHSFAVLHTGRTSNEVMDELLIQKILPKLRGSERQRSLLESLRQRLADMPRTVREVEALLADLDETGSFQYLR